MHLRNTTPVKEKEYSDFIQPFMIDHSSIRGRFVRLGKALDDILTAHDYPLTVSLHLAEQAVIACMLSATLEKGGILTIQAKGAGAVKMLVVDVMAGGIIRGHAQMDEEALAKVAAGKSKKLSISEIMGSGYLAVTLDDGKSKDRYQGIVELKGDSISDSFKGYFMQSQQGEIAINVVVRVPDKKNKKWLAGGVIIERMPLKVVGKWNILLKS